MSAINVWFDFISYPCISYEIYTHKKSFSLNNVFWVSLDYQDQDVTIKN